MKKKDIVSLHKGRIKPVEHSIAQNVTQCESYISLEVLSSETLLKLEAIKKRSFDLHVFAVLQFRNALRVSELLNVLPGDLDAIGRLKISASKGGNPKIIELGEFKEYIASLAKMGLMPWSRFNRFYVNREYLRVGIQLQVSGGVRRSVTHALRHISTEILNDKSEDLGFAQTLLSHKSNKVTPVYVERKSAKLLDQERRSGASSGSEKANRDKEVKRDSDRASDGKKKEKKT